MGCRLCPCQLPLCRLSEEEEFLTLDDLAEDAVGRHDCDFLADSIRGVWGRCC